MLCKVMPCEMCPTCRYYGEPGGLRGNCHECENIFKYKRNFWGKYPEVKTTEMECEYYESK